MFSPSQSRRMLAGFAARVAVLSAAALGCFWLWGRAQGGLARAGEPGVRVLFTGWGGIVERQVFTRLVADFERRNPGIRVDYRPVPRDYTTKLKLMFAGQTPPDVFYIPDGDFPGFAAAGRLLNLQPLVERSRVVVEREIWDSGLRRYRFDGRVFGRGALHALPKDIGPQAMFVNLDLLRETGIDVAALFPPSGDPRPLSWPAALSLWSRLTRDRDGDGRVDQWGTHGMELEAAVWSAGGEFLSGDGRTFVMDGDPRALEGADWLAALQWRHRVAPMERHRQSIPVDTLFMTGRLATFVGGRWMVPQFRRAEFSWDVLPIPASPRTGKPAGRSGSVGLAISPSCRHPDAAWRLVEFLAGPEGQAAQARTGFQLPNQRSLAASDLFLQPEERPRHAGVFLAAARHQRAGPPTRTPDSEWFDLLIRALAPVYRGETSAARAVRRARPEIQAALDRGWSALR